MTLCIPFHCGMRRPSLGQNGGDLSRLTSTSSDTEQNKTTVTSNSNTQIATIKSPTYLPDFIDSNEWIKSSRKRKERQDSTSSLTQERKLVRSNSEEYIPNNFEEYDALRRVSSHEDFKKSPSTEIDDDNNENNENKIPNRNEEKISTLDVIETNHNLPQKYRLSPVLRIDAEIDGGEHERQRYNERFTKVRDIPRRKAMSPRKPSKHSSSGKMMRDREESSYKYDISALKNERRGFISTKHKYETKIDEIDLNKKTVIAEQQPADISDCNENNLIELNLPKTPNTKIGHEDILPWSKKFHVDSPIVCQRFADSTYNHVTNSQDAPVSATIDIKCFGSDSFANGGCNLIGQSKLQRDTIKKSPSFYLTADEKVKQINKRLIVLKKRLSQYEDKFESNFGHKPSQSDKTADTIIKNLISEISKLRKEKHSLRTEPRNFMYNNNKHNEMCNDEAREDIKLNKMKETLLEIEKRLQRKRTDDKRSPELESLTPDELIKEKTAVQKGLLYLESIFGRPVSRLERDSARPLYDRYRIIKRLVNRNATLSGSGISVPELPTILEGEAMAFTGTSSSNERTSFSSVSINESPSDTSDSIQSTDSTDTSSSMTENVHIMSIQDLWSQYDVTRDEAKNLKKSIKEFEEIFEERNGRKMLKADRKLIEETYSLYKQKKAKVRLLDALIKKHMSSY